MPLRLKAPSRISVRRKSPSHRARGGAELDREARDRRQCGPDMVQQAKNKESIYEQTGTIPHQARGRTFPDHAPICPTGKSRMRVMRNLPVVPLCRRRAALPKTPNQWLPSALSRPLERGVSRSSRTLGAGCGGRFGDARRAALTRTAKPCGPDAPTLASSLRMKIRRRRWQKSPVTGESSE